MVKTVAHVSNGGSLEGRQPLVAFHPDFLQELFGQRLGIEPGGKDIAMNNPAKHVEDVILKGVYSTDTLNATDSEQKAIRTAFFTKGHQGDDGNQGGNIPDRAGAVQR